VLDDVPALVDNEAKALVLRKKSQPVPTIVLVDSPFAQAGDLSFSDALLNERWLDSKTLGDNRRIDLNCAIFELDCWHRKCYPDEFAITRSPDLHTLLGAADASSLRDARTADLLRNPFDLAAGDRQRHLRRNFAERSDRRGKLGVGRDSVDVDDALVEIELRVVERLGKGRFQGAP